MASSHASSGSSGGLALPAPLVRLTDGPHSEPNADGGTYTVQRRLQVATADYSDALANLDLRVELLRSRKQRTHGKHGWQWVHPADHTGQANTLDGGRSRGGNHFNNAGAPMVERRTSFPVAGEYAWTDVPVGAWWKQGSVLLGDGTGNDKAQIDMPVLTGTKSTNRYDYGGGHLPQWKSVGGVLTGRLTFRLSAIDPDGEDARDRLTGPIAAARVVMRPIVSTQNQASPTWPDGAGGADGVTTTVIGIWLQDQQ